MQGAYHLARVLENAMHPVPHSPDTALLKNASVHVLTGHGGSSQVTKVCVYVCMCVCVCLSVGKC